MSFFQRKGVSWLWPWCSLYWKPCKH